MEIYNFAEEPHAPPLQFSLCVFCCQLSLRMQRRAFFNSSHHLTVALQRRQTVTHIVMRAGIAHYKPLLGPIGWNSQRATTVSSDFSCNEMDHFKKHNEY